MTKGRSLALLMAVAGLCAGRASAWDPDAHEAIARTALAISPAAEARIPLEFRDAFWAELRTADLADRICRFHRGPEARKEPAAEAARALADLGTAAAQRPYGRARALARYLHWVADTAVPTPIAAGRVYEVKDFWSNIDYLVFRERHPLDRTTLARDLTTVGNAAQWADDAPGAWPATLRLAVNVTIEALLLLPPRPGAAAASDEGPVVFVVNRQDTGRASAKSSVWAAADDEYLFVAVVRTVDAGPVKRDLMRRRGVQVAEAVTRKGPSGTAVRAVLFNNGDAAACEVWLKTARWSFQAGNLSPGDLLPIEFELPRDADLGRVKVSWTTSHCASSSARAVATARRIVLGSTGAPPRLEQAAEVVDVGTPPVAVQRPGIADIVPSRANAAEVFREEPSAREVDLGGTAGWDLRQIFETKSFRVRRQDGQWRFLLAGRNVSDRRLGTLEVQVEASFEEKGKPPVTVTLRFDGDAVGPMQTAELSSAAEAPDGRPFAFRLTQFRRVPALPESRVPKVTNQVARP